MTMCVCPIARSSRASATRTSSSSSTRTRVSGLVMVRKPSANRRILHCIGPNFDWRKICAAMLIRLGPFLLLSILLVLPETAPIRVFAQSGELPAAAPKEAGFSGERLAALDLSLKKYVDDGALSGIVALVTRHGRIVSSNTYGYQDLARKVPMRPDTIFRIYSMTKPITGAAMMKLYEQGK